MRKLIVFGIILLLSVSLVEAAPSLSVSWQLSTEILRPNSEATITLTFTNTGLTEITNVFVRPTLGPYLKLTSGVSELVLGAISSTSSQQGSISIKVDEKAISSTSFVSLKVEYYAGTSSSYSKTLSIPVSIRRYPILQIENVNYDTSPEPGKTTTLSFDVVNAGDGPAKDLKIKLSQSDLFIVSSSSGEVLIDSLEAPEKENVEFSIIINPEASVGIESIEVSLSYYDETKSTRYTETSKIGTKISGEADFIVSADSGTSFYYGGVGEAEITISNSGTGSAEFISIKATSEYGSKEFYIGSLDPDDSDTIELLQDLRGVSGKYPIKLEISYRDKFQNKYTVEKVVEAVPGNAPLDFTMIFVVLVVAVAAVWYYRKRKKK